MARGKSDSSSYFPKIREEDVDTALSRIGDRVLDKPTFTRQVLEGSMADSDPSLRLGLEHRAITDRIIFPDKYTETEPQIKFGAALMFSVMGELEKEGYAFPTLEDDTVTTDEEQSIDLFTNSLKKKMDLSPNEELDIDEIIGITEETASSTGYEIVTTDAIVSENPGLLGIFDMLNSHEQVGARTVYRLKRKQHEITQMRRLLGEDPASTAESDEDPDTD